MKAEQPAEQPARAVCQVNDTSGDVIDLVSGSDQEDDVSLGIKSGKIALFADQQHTDAEPASDLSSKSPAARAAAAVTAATAVRRTPSQYPYSSSTAAAAAAALTAAATTAFSRTIKPAATFPLCAPRALPANRHIARPKQAWGHVPAAAGGSNHAASRRGVKRPAEQLMPEADTCREATAQQLPEKSQKQQRSSSHQSHQQQEDEPQPAQHDQQQQLLTSELKMPTHQQAPMLVSQQFQQLLEQKATAVPVKCPMAPFKLWAKVCGEDDVRLLLPRFDVLLQHLVSNTEDGMCMYRAKRVRRLLSTVKHVLESVQEDLGSQQHTGEIIATVRNLQAQWNAGTDSRAAVQAVLEAAAASEAAAEPTIEEEEILDSVADCDGNASTDPAPTDDPELQTRPGSGAAAAAAGDPPAVAAGSAHSGLDRDEYAVSDARQAEGPELQTRVASGAAAPAPAVATGVPDGHGEQAAGFDADQAEGHPVLQTTQQLWVFLKQRFSLRVANNCMRAFQLWSKACETDDLRSLLLQFDTFVQKLQATGADGKSAHSPDSAVSYLYWVQHGVQWPELQQLLSRQQADRLLNQVHTAYEALKAASKAAATPRKQKDAAAPGAPTATAGLATAAAEAAAADTPTEQQQQQQQQRSVTVEQLRDLLVQDGLAPLTAGNYTAPFKHWKNACRSDELAVLLPQFDALVQHLSSRNADGSFMFAPQTACAYMGYIRRVLKLPEVQQLMSSHGTLLEDLRADLAAANKRFRAAQHAEQLSNAAEAQEASGQEGSGEHEAAPPPGSAAGSASQTGQPVDDVAAAHATAQAAAQSERRGPVAPVAACAGADAVHSQHQEQQMQHTPSGGSQPTMTIQQLQQLLKQSPAYTDNVCGLTITAVRFWAKSCSNSSSSSTAKQRSSSSSSSDLAVLLQNVDPLLAELSSTKADGSPVCAPSTCQEYLRLLIKLLQLPEVWELLPSDQAALQLKHKLDTARKQFQVRRAKAPAAAAEAEVLAAAAAAAEPSPLPQRNATPVSAPRTPVAAAADDDDAGSRSFEGKNAADNAAGLTGSKKRAADQECDTAVSIQSGSPTHEQQQPSAKRHRAAERQKAPASRQHTAAQQLHQEMDVTPSSAAGAGAAHCAGAAANLAATTAPPGPLLPPQQSSARVAATDAHAVQSAVLSVIARLDELKLPEHYAINEYLSSTLLKAAASYSPLQLQVLQQLLNWLVQLPAGNGRLQLIGALQQHEGWLERLVKCWAAEVELTGCAVDQAATAATEWYASEHGVAAAASAADGRSLGGYLAGLCQMVLKLLAACCHTGCDITAAAMGTTAAQQTDHRQQQQQQQMLDSSSSDALRQLAVVLGSGTAALLLCWPVGASQQLRCTEAGLWRNCLWRNLKACSSDRRISVKKILTQVQEQLERIPQQQDTCTS